jgi:hypothetical protein
LVGAISREAGRYRVKKRGRWLRIQLEESLDA